MGKLELSCNSTKKDPGQQGQHQSRRACIGLWGPGSTGTHVESIEEKILVGQGGQVDPFHGMSLVFMALYSNLTSSPITAPFLTLLQTQKPLCCSPNTLAGCCQAFALTLPRKLFSHIASLLARLFKHYLLSEVFFVHPLKNCKPLFLPHASTPYCLSRLIFLHITYHFTYFFYCSFLIHLLPPSLECKFHESKSFVCLVH